MIRYLKVTSPLFKQTSSKIWVVDRVPEGMSRTVYLPSYLPSSSPIYLLQNKKTTEGYLRISSLEDNRYRGMNFCLEIEILKQILRNVQFKNFVLTFFIYIFHIFKEIPRSRSSERIPNHPWVIYKDFELT